MKAVVSIEKRPGSDKLRNVSLELVAKAVSLMKPLGGQVIGLFVGDSLPVDKDELFAYGLDRLLYTCSPELAYLQSDAYARILAGMIQKEDPFMVLFGATHNGRDIAPRVAAKLRTGLTADCTQLYIDEYKDKGKILFQMRPAFGGNILATIITPDKRPIMATVREGVMALPADRARKPVHLEEFVTDISKEWLKNIFLSVIPRKRSVDFGGAQVVVAGGAGVGSREAFNLLHELADAMGGEVGASRAAVDFGFTEKERQIGQTGSVVRPKLYIACGISGSIQHRAGMEESRKIIAINSDPDAPIFGIAHYGIVGDLKEVIPMMIKYIREEG